MAMNGLERITGKILAEAQEEADRILAAAREECERISRDYATRADQIRDRLSAEAEQEATDLIARAKAAAATQKRNRMLSEKSRILDEVFASALAELRGRKDDAYTETLIGLLAAALLEQHEAETVSRSLYGDEEAMAPDAYEVMLNARDRERYGHAVVDGACKKLGGKLPTDMLNRVKLSEKTASIDGGLILRCGDVESNCSFSLILAGLREELEAEVSHALFDEIKRP